MNQTKEKPKDNTKEYRCTRMRIYPHVGAATPAGRCGYIRRSVRLHPQVGAAISAC